MSREALHLSLPQIQFVVWHRCNSNYYIVRLFLVKPVFIEYPITGLVSTIIICLKNKLHIKLQLKQCGFCDTWKLSPAYLNVYTYVYTCTYTHNPVPSQTFCMPLALCIFFLTFEPLSCRICSSKHVRLAHPVMVLGPLHIAPSSYVCIVCTA